MNVIVYIDALASLAVAGSIIVIGCNVLKRRTLVHKDVLVLSLLLALLCFYICLTVEWGWPQPFLDRAKGFLAIVLPMLWGYAFYGVQQEKKNADLKQNEMLLHHFIDNQPVGLCRTSIQQAGGRFVVANPALAHMLRYRSVQQLMASNVSDFYRNPEERDRIMDRLIRDGRIDGLEIEGKRKDGSGIHVSMTMRLIRDADGKPIEVEGTIEDVTSRKRAEQALHRREQLHRQAQKIAKLGHWEVVPVDGIPVWSEEMYRIFEFAKDEFDGTLEMFLGRVHPEDRDPVAAHIADAWENGSEINQTHRILLPDNRVKYVHSMGRMEYDENDQPIRMLGTCQDITRQKMVELEKEKTEHRLRQAHKLEAIGTLAGGIAHDFNNILTSIIGYTQLSMRRLPADSPMMSQLDAVLQAGLRARDLVANILAFSRKSEQVLQPVQVPVIVKEVIKLLRASIPANIEIIQDISRSNRRVLADPVQIHQVIMNLGTNAYQAIGSGGGKITIALSESDIGPNDRLPGFDASTGPHIHLSVGDNGHGIDPLARDKIFDPYFTTKKIGEGTGLGLSVVHGIVKKLNGQISVHSESGQGTTFHVFLPLVDTDQDVVAEARRAPEPGHSEHILIVDDEPPIVKYLSELLTALGYRVTAFTASHDALAFVAGRSDAPELMITDMTMPGICGDELSRRILALMPDLPIIICTGFSDRLDEEKAQAIGIRAYMPKPVTEQQLSESIRRLLRNSIGLP